MAEQLIPYVVDMGFTHIELLPVSEHPLDASWGYQPIGLFAPTRRFGDPAGFQRFVDARAQRGPWRHPRLGARALSRPTSTASPILTAPPFTSIPTRAAAFTRTGTPAIYDFGRREVANFLTANALYWLDRFHIDGLRVDAVASMLYLDYSRQPGEWLPNAEGGNENRDAVRFLQAHQRAGLRHLPRHHDHRRRIRPPGPACRSRPAPAASASASNGTWAG